MRSKNPYTKGRSCEYSRGLFSLPGTWRRVRELVVTVGAAVVVVVEVAVAVALREEVVELEREAAAAGP